MPSSCICCIDVGYDTHPACCHLLSTLNQDVHEAGEGVLEAERRIVALQLFQRRLAGGDDGAEAAVQKRLPLEPALARMRFERLSFPLLESPEILPCGFHHALPCGLHHVLPCGLHHVLPCGLHHVLLNLSPLPLSPLCPLQVKYRVTVAIL